MYRLSMQGFFCCMFDIHRTNGLFSIINLYPLSPSLFLFPLPFSASPFPLICSVQLLMLFLIPVMWRDENCIDLGQLKVNYQRDHHCPVLCRFSRSHGCCMYGYDNMILASIFIQTHVHKIGSIRSVIIMAMCQGLCCTLGLHLISFSWYYLKIQRLLVPFFQKYLFHFLVLSKDIAFVIPIFQK